MRLIDADALNKRIEEIHCTDCDNWHGVKCKACEMCDAMTYIDEAPTVEQKHGHWIKVDDEGYKCSCCNTYFIGLIDPCDRLCNFCLTCGAKMDEVTE